MQAKLYFDKNDVSDGTSDFPNVSKVS